MRSITGIEVGDDACVLVRVRRAAGLTRVSAVQVLDRPEPGADAGPGLADRLRRARAEKGLPARARVVAWETAAPGPAGSASDGMLGQIRDAGFSVERVFTPPEALALLAAGRPRPAGAGASALLALNRRRAAIAIAAGGDLLYAREFAWVADPAFRPHDRLLHRYSLVAQLAPELQHAMDVVRESHGVRVEAVATCGNLADLRSLTMPLIEELDIDVETLDALDGLEVRRPADTEVGAEDAPALRLACAAASAPIVREPRVPIVLVARAAAVVGVSAAAWWAYSALGPQGRAPGPPGEPPAVRTEPQGPAGALASSPPPAPPAAMDVESRPAAGTGRVPAAAPVRAEDAPAGTTGRGTDAAPLQDPLPVVSSILVSQQRRLAVVDGVIAREGDVLGRRVLVTIDSDAVVFREPSGRRVRVPIRTARGGGRREPG